MRIVKRSEHARGVWGHAPLENFEKLDPKSCNLTELKVILLNWKKTFFGGRIFFGVFLRLTCPLALQFLNFCFDFIEYVM
jgi:hypothetical protein